MGSIITRAGGTTVNTVSNPKPYIYLPLGWDTAWKTAKAAKAGTVMIIGASQAQGNQQLSNIVTKRWPRVFLNWLNSTVGGSLVAETFTYTDNTNFAGTWSASGTPPWAVGGAASGDANDGFCKMLQSAGGVGVVMTLTTPFTCTDVDFFFRDLLANTGTYSVDGGGGVNYTTNADGTCKRVQITGLSNIVHTVAISQAVASQIGLLGATCYYGARGATGWTLAHHSGNGQNFFGNYNIAGTATCFKTLKATLGNIAAPDLLIVMTGGNEDNANNDVTWGLSWIIEAVKVSNPNVSVLILAEPCFSPSNSDVSGSFGAGYGLHYYMTRQRMQGLALDNGFGFIDLHVRWSPNPVAQGFINSGTGAGQPHPNDAGHADIAVAVESVL